MENSAFIVATLTAVAAFLLILASSRVEAELNFVRSLAPPRTLAVTGLLYEALHPLTRLLAGRIKRLALGAYRQKLEEDLLASGLDRRATPDEFLAFRVLLATACGGVALGLASSQPRVIVFLLLSFGLLYPSLWLHSLRVERRREIRRHLAFAVDLLALLVAAGLDFWAATEHVVRQSPPGLLRDELARALQDQQLGGATTSEALSNLARRVDVQELRALTAVLAQAHRLGTSVAEELAAQAESLRVQRFHRAEAEGAKAASKLALPLVFCIAPAALIILCGAVVLKMVESGLVR